MDKLPVMPHHHQDQTLSVGLLVISWHKIKVLC